MRWNGYIANLHIHTLGNHIAYLIFRIQVDISTENKLASKQSAALEYMQPFTFWLCTLYYTRMLQQCVVLRRSSQDVNKFSRIRIPRSFAVQAELRYYEISTFYTKI